MEKSADSSSSSPAHVLIFPLPIQGHVNSMLKLVELLSLSPGLTITFVNSDNTHGRLLRHADIVSRFDRVRFVAVPDGLPAEHPRAGMAALDILNSMEEATRPVFRDVVVNSQPRVDCIIGDGALGFVSDVADELGIKLFHFRTASACSFWAYFCIPDMIGAGELPIRGTKDMDRAITAVPGMETFLRCRDLPSFCQVTDKGDPLLQILATRTRRSSKTLGLIQNTFEELEGPVLSRIREKCPNVYAIGPLHLHVKTRSSMAAKEVTKPSVNSLWEVDRSCIDWLDRQPEKSVVYVSFGSLTQVTREELMEFWYGLVNSKQKFLWVIRPELTAGIDVGKDISADLTERNGCVVGWAPQEEVLAHRAIGAFLTHSGWNSTLESVSAGIPMICWPFFADQQLNSRYVEQVWKAGLDMKDVCDRSVVERMVNDVMVERRDEFAESTARIARLARESVSDGGSSFLNLDRLIEDIKLMCAQKP